VAVVGQRYLDLLSPGVLVVVDVEVMAMGEVILIACQHYLEYLTLVVEAVVVGMDRTALQVDMVDLVLLLCQYHYQDIVVLQQVLLTYRAIVQQ
jgi:hypothetical protein